MTATDERPATRPQKSTDLYAWVLSVLDWQVHALASPQPDVWAGALQTRCGARHLAGCPVSVARRGEVCARCDAGGVERLELVTTARNRRYRQ